MKFPTRNGNNKDTPCAYPSENKAGCLKDVYLSGKPIINGGLNGTQKLIKDLGENKMKTGYFLTNQDMTTRKGFKNEIGVAATVTGTLALCTASALHFYEHPILAVLFNPMHADYRNPRMFECEVGEYITDGLKCGTQYRKPIREIEIPVITIEQRVEFAIRCALEVYKEPYFIAWANAWLDGTDRSEKTARAATDATEAITTAAGVARAATGAAERAARASEWTAETAARAAERAAEAAAELKLNIDFIEIWEKVK